MVGTMRIRTDSVRTARSFWGACILPMTAWFLMVSLASVSGAVEPLADPKDSSLGGAERVDALIAQIKHRQAGLESLQASFVQTKESALLLAPEESRGSFSFRAPDDARWEFTAPNQTVMVVRAGEMITWYRDLGTAEKVSIGEHSSRVEQYLSATNSIDRLQRYFDLATAFPGDDSPFRIELTPRYERVAKRVKRMVIWFDQERYVPVRILYEEPDGDTTDMVLEKVEVNIDVPDAQFELNLPEDVELKTVELAG